VGTDSLLELDDRSNCEVGTISFPNKTLGRQAAQELDKITLKEEFRKMNKLTSCITLSSGITGPGI
jgi:hypothetical protein